MTGRRYSWLNVGCGTHLAPSPWVNIDVVENDNTHPDVLVKSGEPMPFPDGSAERIHLGHVLEHVPWTKVRPFLVDMRRLLTEDGEVLVDGPDVYRTIQRWRNGQEPWEMVTSVLEHQHPDMDLAVDWPEALHQWNCYEQRVVDAMVLAGFQDVTPLPPVPESVAGWPAVGVAGWWCVVRARR